MRGCLLVSENEKVFVVIGIQNANLECLNTINSPCNLFRTRVIELWLNVHSYKENVAIKMHPGEQLEYLPGFKIELSSKFSIFYDFFSRLNSLKVSLEMMIDQLNKKYRKTFTLSLMYVLCDKEESYRLSYQKCGVQRKLKSNFYEY